MLFNILQSWPIFLDWTFYFRTFSHGAIDSTRFTLIHVQGRISWWRSSQKMSVGYTNFTRFCGIDELKLFFVYNFHQTIGIHTVQWYQQFIYILNCSLSGLGVKEGYYSRRKDQLSSGDTLKFFCIRFCFSQNYSNGSVECSTVGVLALAPILQNS